jgi:hypothetical protein
MALACMVLGDRSAAAPGLRPHCIFQAVIQVIVDQRLFGGGNRLLHGMQLLDDREARLALVDHRDDVVQVAIGALEPVADLRMSRVEVSG